MSARFSSLSVLVCSLLCADSALANGRMPGANELVFSSGDSARLVSRATFGIIESADHGANWSWICEQAIDVSGVIADPPLALSESGSLVLLPPTGSALVSSDRGCNWVRAGAPLAGTRGADLTLDPGDSKRVLVVTSTLRKVSDAGFGSYENLVVETRDDGRSFQLLATLPDDFEAETIEVAHGDAHRIYVSGSDTLNGRLGVLLRSDDGGVTWNKTTLALPAGTGSLWISGIHPNDPDKLWLRVAARGDTLGLLPARLYLSTDMGQSFVMLASTTKGMFGFALSPDGSTIAYGGPGDGLHVGPSDGSAFVKRSALGVRCLRWPERGALYACASEPADAFSIGVSSDDGVSFRALYRLADTCPAACATGSSFAGTCQAAWSQTRPFIAASGATCSVPWSAPAVPVADASTPPGTAPSADVGASASLDASAPAIDGSMGGTTADDAGGCDCQISTRKPDSLQLGWVWMLLTALAFRARQGRRERQGRSSP